MRSRVKGLFYAGRQKKTNNQAREILIGITWFDYNPTQMNHHHRLLLAGFSVVY